MPVEIRNDDIFLVGPLTRQQVLAKRRKPLFEYFKEADEALGQPAMTLAVMADGCGVFPKWTQYIKERLFRFTIQMHGLHHENYQNLTEEEGFKDLSLAKEIIEREFGIQVTQWYPPQSQRGYPDWGPRVCARLGINFHATGSCIHQEYFHYWNPKSVDKIKKYVQQ